MRQKIAPDGAEIVVAVEEPFDRDELRLGLRSQLRLQRVTLRVVHA